MDRRRLLLGLAATASAPALLGAGSERLRAFDVGSSRVRLTIGDGPLAVSRDDVLRWVRDCCEAVAAWYGRFPVHPLELAVVPGDGDGVYGGRTVGGPVPRVRVHVGATAELADLYGDWILVHELVHLAFPNVPRAHHWIEEGLATYVEPWIRVACGQLTADRAWGDLVDGLPQGQPAAGDRGLDHTPTWGRTYWGGALYCLLVDVALRRQTPDVGLKQALIGILRAGGNMTVSWPLERALAVGDAATGRTVLTDTWRAHRDRAVRVDLDAMWRELGVVRAGDGIAFDDTAPGAGIHRAIDGTGGAP